MSAPVPPLSFVRYYHYDAFTPPDGVDEIREWHIRDEVNRLLLCGVEIEYLTWATNGLDGMPVCSDCRRMWQRILNRPG